jgi:hypothetical protein
MSTESGWANVKSVPFLVHDPFLRAFCRDEAAFAIIVVHAFGKL